MTMPARSYPPFDVDTFGECRSGRCATPLFRNIKSFATNASAVSIVGKVNVIFDSMSKLSSASAD
jgi:hypothetical protein